MIHQALAVKCHDYVCCMTLPFLLYTRSGGSKDMGIVKAMVPDCCCLGMSNFTTLSWQHVHLVMTVTAVVFRSCCWAFRSDTQVAVMVALSQREHH